MNAALLPADFSPQLPFAVGFSGGADSTALLLAAHRRWPGQVVAWHVNHGLQAAAADFEAHCVKFCAAQGIALKVARVQVALGGGESPENMARKARWLAFEHLSLSIKPLFQENSAVVHVFIHFDAIKNAYFDKPIDHVALAHHADDQAETVLLALSRGAGLPGLSAMPAQMQRGTFTVHRPLLAVDSASIRVWLTTQGHAWIEDPSNQSEAFTRNRIRARVLPQLELALPGFTKLVARSAQHAAQAQDLLADLAALDEKTVGNPPHINSLQSLSPERQANVLRHWLKNTHQTQASTAQMTELLAQVACCTTRGHRISIKLGAGQVLRVGQNLGFSQRD